MVTGSKATEKGADELPSVVTLSTVERMVADGYRKSSRAGLLANS